MICKSVDTLAITLMTGSTPKDAQATLKSQFKPVKERIPVGFTLITNNRICCGDLLIL